MSNANFPCFDTLLPKNDDNALVLQQCAECKAVNYPPRELCSTCLADALSWQPCDNNGQVLSLTVLQHSMEAAFLTAMPCTIASVALKNGPTLITHAAKNLVIGQEVRVISCNDNSGNRVLFCVKTSCSANEALAAWQNTGLS